MRLFLAKIGAERTREGLKGSAQDEPSGLRPDLTALYSVTKEEAIKTSAFTTLVYQYDESLSLAIMTVFPDHAWEPWMFARSPRNWWGEVATRFKQGDALATGVVRAAFDAELAPAYGISQPVEWLTKERRMFGNSTDYHLVRFGRLEEVVKRIYPEVDWESLAPQHIQLPEQGRGNYNWVDPKVRREFLDGLRLTLASAAGNNKSAPTPTVDWLYYIRWKDYFDHGGHGLLAFNQKSTVIPVLREYPEHGWQVWRFTHTLANWWGDLGRLWKAHDIVAEAVVRERMEAFAKEFDIMEEVGWWKIGTTQLGSALNHGLAHLGGFEAVLKRLYPATDWKGFSSSTKAALQTTLESATYGILPTPKD